MDCESKYKSQNNNASRRKHYLHNLGIKRFLGHDAKALIIKEEKLEKLDLNKI